MSYRFLLLILLLAIFSCKEKMPEALDSKILGEWKTLGKDYPKDNDLPPLPGSTDIGFTFRKDGSCDIYPGFIDPSEKEDYFVYTEGLGNYQVRGDSLFITSPKKNINKSYKIYKLCKDTLVIGDFPKYTLTRRKYDLNNVPDFDAIIVSSEPCYGRCPINNIHITRKLTVQYEGESFNKEKGLYTTSIPVSEFQRIVLAFKKAQYHTLKKKYWATHTDDATITIVFIKDGKIIKSISDYGESSPAEFIWAYQPLGYYSQKLTLKKIEIDRKKFRFSTIGFITAGKEMNLTKAESYYLSDILNSAHVVEICFTERYIVEGSEDPDIFRITTDGRYYKFHFNDKSTIIVDIGFNFLDNPNLANNFEIR
jgi:hypothetical protein